MHAQNNDRDGRESNVARPRSKFRHAICKITGAHHRKGRAGQRVIETHGIRTRPITWRRGSLSNRSKAPGSLACRRASAPGLRPRDDSTRCTPLLSDRSSRYASHHVTMLYIRTLVPESTLPLIHRLMLLYSFLCLPIILFAVMALQNNYMDFWEDKPMIHHFQRGLMVRQWHF